MLSIEIKEILYDYYDEVRNCVINEDYDRILDINQKALEEINKIYNKHYKLIEK